MSPKNKGKFGRGKPAVEADDQFVSGVADVADKLKPHTRIIAAITAVLGVGLIVWYTVQYLNERTEMQATVEYEKALTVLRQSVEPATDTDTDSNADADDASGADEKVFRSYAERAQAVADAFGSAGNEHSSAAASAQFSLIEATARFELGEYQKAADLYSAYLEAHGDDAALRVVAQEGLGYAQEAIALKAEGEAARQSGLEQALATFQQLQAGDDSPWSTYARYHEGRLLAMLGRRDEAIAALRAALDSAGDGQRGVMTYDIKQRLTQMESAAGN